MRIHVALLLVTLPAFAAEHKLEEIKAWLDSPIEPRGTGSCPAPEHFSLTRPDSSGTPTVVGLAVLFQDVSALSDVDQTISADLYLVERWLDPPACRGEESFRTRYGNSALTSSAALPAPISAASRRYSPASQPGRRRRNKDARE
jgi:hypothetical protein